MRARLARPQGPDDRPGGGCPGCVRRGLERAVLFGADVARQCIDEGLVDEILVHLAPVMLGDGVRLFSSRGTGRIKLERTSVAQHGQVTDLRFRVVK